MTDAEAVDAADVVFTGTLLEFELPEEGGQGDELMWWRFRVEAVEKGPLVANAMLTTPVSGGSCDVPHFMVGQRHRVFAHRRDGGLHAGICSATHATDEVRGQLVGAFEDVHGGGPWSATLWALGVAGVMLTAVVAIALVRRTRREVAP